MIILKGPCDWALYNSFDERFRSFSANNLSFLIPKLSLVLELTLTGETIHTMFILAPSVQPFAILVHDYTRNKYLELIAF